MSDKVLSPQENRIINFTPAKEISPYWKDKQLQSEDRQKTALTLQTSLLIYFCVQNENFR